MPDSRFRRRSLRSDRLDAHCSLALLDFLLRHLVEKFLLLGTNHLGLWRLHGRPAQALYVLDDIKPFLLTTHKSTSQRHDTSMGDARQLRIAAQLHGATALKAMI